MYSQVLIHWEVPIHKDFLTAKITKCKNGFLGSTDYISYQALFQEVDTHNINTQSYYNFFHIEKPLFNSTSHSSYHSISFLPFTAKLPEKASILSQNFLLLSLKLGTVKLSPLLSPLHQNCSCHGRSHVYVAKSLLILHDLLVTLVIIDCSFLLDAFPLTWLPDVFPAFPLPHRSLGCFPGP